MNKSCTKAWVLLSLLLLAACTPTASKIQEAISLTQAAWTPIPSQTAYPTYTPVKSPIPSLTPTWPNEFTLPTINPQVLIQEYTTASYRVIGLLQNPYAPYVLILATERAPVLCGSPDECRRSTDDTMCGSIYSSPTCFFFVEPNYVHGVDPAPRFVASWSGVMAGLRIELIHFLNAQAVEFRVTGGDAMTMVIEKYKLDLQTGEITNEESEWIETTPSP